MKKVVSIFTAVLMVLVVFAPTFAATDPPKIPPKGIEGPDVRVRIPPKGIEGPDIRENIPPKGAEGPDVR